MSPLIKHLHIDVTVGDYLIANEDCRDPVKHFMLVKSVFDHYMSIFSRTQKKNLTVTLRLNGLTSPCIDWLSLIS